MSYERSAMKALAGVVALSLAVTALPGAAGADPSASIEAKVKIAQPLEFSPIFSLRFGGVAGSSKDGTVIVATDGARSATGGAKLTKSSAEFGPAECTISGEPGASYSIIQPGLPLTANKDEPAASKVSILDVVDLKSLSETFGTESATGQLDGGGTDTVLVGGTLVVPANTPGGTYRAEIVLTIAYQ